MESFRLSIIMKFLNFIYLFILQNYYFSLKPLVGKA